MVSKISLLRVNPTNEIFGHVVSYRRQVYVSDLDEENLPGSFIITDYDSIYRIFITLDEFICFKCKSP